MFKRSACFVFLVLLLCLTDCATQSDRVTLTIAGGATGKELELTITGTQRFMELNPNVRVNVRPSPQSNAGRLALYESLLAEESDEVDVLQIDVVWVGNFADSALDLTGLIPQSEINKHFDSGIRNNTVGGKLVAIPWFIDAPYLFYRTDLLAKYGYQEPPTTWDELEEMSMTITHGERQENFGFWGYLWQGSAYEGLTCDALEWQYSHGGGNFVDSDGVPNLTNPGSQAAFTRAASWIGRISPPQVLQFDEEDSRFMWQKGNAAFMRNWSHYYSRARSDSDIKDRFAVAPLPGGPAGRAGTLGGWQLMVSKFSKYPIEAAALVQFLTSAAEQKRRAIEGSYNPSLRSLYRDPEILAAVPFFEGFESVYSGLVARPSTLTGENYLDISDVYSQAVYDILNGAEPAKRLAEAEEAMKAILR
jgi:trehalose/maltose transport system substrate-binding protein